MSAAGPHAAEFAADHVTAGAVQPAMLAAASGTGVAGGSMRDAIFGAFDAGTRREPCVRRA